MLKGIAATASLFLLFSGQIALAQSPPSVTVTSNATGQLLDGDIYAIDIVCQQQQGKELKEAIDRSWLATNTRTHAILISTAATTKKADGNDKLPDSTLTAVEVFSVDKSTTYVDHRDCEHHFLVAGGKRYFIIGTINVLDDFANSPAGTGFSNLATIVSPLFTLFTGNPLPAIIAGKLTNLQAVQNPIQNILNALNRGKNFTRIVQIVGSGTYTVKTPYSIVTIKVRPVPSVVLDGNSTFRTDFRAQINAAPEKIDVNNIDKSCQGVRSGLTESSFTSRTDIAYALIALAAKASFGRDQVIRCLTRNYAPSAIAMPDAVWQSFPAELRFTQEDVDNLLPAPPWPAQPSFVLIKPKLDQLVIALAQYARNTAHPPKAVNSLTQLLSDKVSLVDDTSDLKITGSTDPLDRFAAIDTIVSKKYIRFGCYAATTDDTGQDLDGAVAMFLAFEAPSDAPSTTIDKALVLRPIYTNRVVTSLNISVNRKYVTAVLNDRGFDCNGFTVEQLKAQPGGPPGPPLRSATHQQSRG